MITRDATLIVEGVSTELLRDVLNEHAYNVIRLQKLDNYYRGKHDILNRERTRDTINNKLVCNHAKYIVDLASGYLIGNPVGYSDDEQEKQIEVLNKFYKKCASDSVDAELGKNASVYGKGVEIIYMDKNSMPRTASISPLSAFVVYDDTVAHEPLFGVHINIKSTSFLSATTSRIITVYTATGTQSYKEEVGNEVLIPDIPTSHYFGAVPMVEYWNNADETGDFEPITTLIDAYNVLQSDRLNDKQQLVDAILLIVGTSIGDDIDGSNRVLKLLREQGLLELDGQGADAKYLIKQLNETEVQVLADAITQDMHKLSLVPALTDEDFAGAASGVALRFKLMGLEQLTKVKERWFREGLKMRLKLFATALAIKRVAQINPDTVQMTFTRSLPSNELELSQIVVNLQGIVPDEMLLRQLPFVDDVQSAMDMLAKQKQEAIDMQAKAFKMPQSGGDVDADTEE